MMKNFISIPKPCSENWSNMTPQEQGRHCTKCNIVVKDFSAMSNEEILQYLKLNTDRVCGRVRGDQLQNAKPEITYRLKRFLYAFALCFLPFFTFTSVLLSSSNTIYAQTTPGGINGKIVDHKGAPVPFASVGAFEGGVLKGQTKTNFKGNFVIKPLAKGTYTIKISSVALKKLEIQGIQVISGRVTTQNAKMKKKNTKVHMVGLICYPRMVDPQHPGRQVLTSRELRNMGGR